MTSASMNATEVRAERLGAIAGIAGPILFTTAFLLQNFLRTDDDAIAEPVSALEAGSWGWIQQVNFLCLGVLMLTFAFGLSRSLSGSLWATVGPLLLATSSCGLFLAALFPLREDSSGEVYDPGNHWIAGVTFFLSSALALLALSRAFAVDARWRPLSPYCLAAGVVALAGFAVVGRLAVPDSAPLHDYAGLLQRAVIMVVTFPCLVTVALRLLRLSR